MYDKSQPGTVTSSFHLTLSSSVGVGRAERTLLSRCVPLSSLRLISTRACPSFRPWGPRHSLPRAQAELYGSRRCSERLGWGVAGGANRGETLGKAALGGSDSEDG